MPNWKGPQPGPSALRRLIYANRSMVHKIGIYENRFIAGTNTKSHHAEGRALDIYLSVFIAEEKVLGDQLFSAFVDCARAMLIDEVIWNHQIWSKTKPHVHPYLGQRPHTDHVHVGFTRQGSQLTSFGPFAARLAQIRTGLHDAFQATGDIG
jgi:hypothetical protein